MVFIVLVGPLVLAATVPIIAKARRRKGLPCLPPYYWLPAAIGFPVFFLAVILLAPTRYSFAPVVIVALALAASGYAKFCKARRLA